MPSDPHFEIYPEHGDGDPQYRWRFRAANGEITAASGDGFSTPSHANQAIHDFMHDLDNADCGIHPDILVLDGNGELIK